VAACTEDGQEVGYTCKGTMKNPLYDISDVLYIESAVDPAVLTSS
jgi:hypothetical protein